MSARAEVCDSSVHPNAPTVGAAGALGPSGSWGYGVTMPPLTFSVSPET